MSIAVNAVPERVLKKKKKKHIIPSAWLQLLSSAFHLSQRGVIDDNSEYSAVGKNAWLFPPTPTAIFQQPALKISEYISALEWTRHVTCRKLTASLCRLFWRKSVGSAILRSPGRRSGWLAGPGTRAGPSTVSRPRAGPCSTPNAASCKWHVKAMTRISGGGETTREKKGYMRDKTCLLKCIGGKHTRTQAHSKTMTLQRLVCNLTL